MLALKKSKVVGTLALMAVFLLAWGMLALADHHGKPQGKPQIKHVILFIGDGMHLEHEIAASRYLTGGTQLMAWNFFPHRAPMSTWDVSTYNKYAPQYNASPYNPATFNPLVGYDPARGGAWPYPFSTDGQDSYFLPADPKVKPFATDSASAATAWATGYKTDDGNLAWMPGDPPNGALETIAEKARTQQGMAMGVVSTVPFTHATPAAHVSHNISRNNYHAIADEILRTLKPDVVIGGGHPSWTTTYMSTATYEAVKNGAISDYVLAERQVGMDGGKSLRAAALQAVKSNKKLFGLYGGTAGNFESPIPVNRLGRPRVDRATIENPLLEDATVSALEVLSRDPDGFFVMIEQGDIDWANHDNDFGRMIGTVWDLNQAVISAAAFICRPGDDVTWDNTLVLVTSDHSNSYMRLTRHGRIPVLRRGELPVQELTASGDPESAYGGKFKYPNGEVKYSTAQHTNELVMFYGLGAGLCNFRPYEGAWYPGTRIIDNTQLYQVMAEVLGVQ